MAALVKSRLGLYGLVALFVIAITLVVIVGYRVYYNVLADTPDKAVRAYVDTLNKGDMMTLYDLTLGASSQTQAEFASSITLLIKDKRLNFDGAVIESVGQRGGTYYYRIMSRVRSTDGSYRLLPLMLESGQEGGVYRVRLYLPPAALPAGG